MKFGGYKLAWVPVQLAKQIFKIDVGMIWQSAGTRWLTSAKTGFDLRQVRL